MPEPEVERSEQGDDVRELITELRALREEVERLRAEFARLSAGGRDVVEHPAAQLAHGVAAILRSTRPRGKKR